MGLTHDPSTGRSSKQQHGKDRHSALLRHLHQCYLWGGASQIAKAGLSQIRRVWQGCCHLLPECLAGAAALLALCSLRQLHSHKHPAVQRIYSGTQLFHLRSI